MAPTAELVKCRCSLAMEVTSKGAYYCPNCDGVQTQEAHGASRRTTRYDLRYRMYWANVIATEYKDNTGKTTDSEGDTT